MTSTPPPAWRLPADEADEPAFPEPPGGGFVLAVLGGLAAGGSILVFLFVPMAALVVLPLAAILTGAAVTQGRHVFTTTIAAVLPAVVTAFSATCLTGFWGWLAVGIVILAAVVAVVTPIGFGIGRLVRRTLGERGYLVIRAVLVVAGMLSLLAWAMAIANAVAPGECPPAP
jgi:hypothetical protein